MIITIIAGLFMSETINFEPQIYRDNNKSNSVDQCPLI